MTNDYDDQWSWWHMMRLTNDEDHQWWGWRRMMTILHGSWWQDRINTDDDLDCGGITTAVLILHSIFSAWPCGVGERASRTYFLFLVVVFRRVSVSPGVPGNDERDRGASFGLCSYHGLWSAQAEKSERECRQALIQVREGKTLHSYGYRLRRYCIYRSGFSLRKHDICPLHEMYRRWTLIEGFLSHNNNIDGISSFMCVQYGNPTNACEGERSEGVLNRVFSEAGCFEEQGYPRYPNLVQISHPG